MSDFYVHESSYVDDGAFIDHSTKIWHFCHIMKHSKIGANCNIGQNVLISPEVVIGNNVKIQNNVSIYTGVICEDNVFLGPSMVFTNVMNPRSGVNRKNEYKKTLVRKGATIGANATIVCGITLGKFCFIGAGTVVIRDVKDYAMVVGNPAKQIGWMSEYGEKLQFTNNRAVCPATSDIYILENDQVHKEQNL